ncbi:MAG: hypothetical protein RLZ95_599 [Bacteroidota bacterium]|jgi:hypothetical protein
MYITDLQYFGTIQYIQSLMIEKDIVFDNANAFTKMSFKNRTIIATAQGPLSLSIPIIGGRAQKKPLQDIKIDYQTAWHKQHFKSLASNYMRSPYFEYYESDLQAMYQKQTIYLLDFLLTTNSWVKKQLRTHWNVVENLTSIENRTYDAWLPKNYDQIPDPIVYQQVFEEKTGFLPNLSILDLLFCCGGRQANALLMPS